MTIETNRQNIAHSEAVVDSTDELRLGYKGAERRRRQRRGATDRRAEMRFDLNNPDRRVSEGRRVDDLRKYYWH